MTTIVRFSLALVLLGVSMLRAEVHLPSIFGDHMVVQQGVPVPVWGTAAGGEGVTVEFAGKRASATADAQGRWKLSLPALAASAQPQEFVVSGQKRLVFTDVLIGEVWVCSGQSNMVAGQRGLVSKEVEAEKQMRFFVTPGGGYLEPQENTTGRWTVCSNAEWPRLAYSAVGYYFGMELHEKRKVPVGMIQSAVSGTDIFLWEDLAALEKSPTFRKAAQEVLSRRAKLPELMAKYRQEILPAWEKQHGARPAADAPARPEGQPVEGESASGKPKAVAAKRKPASLPKRPEPPDRSGMPSSLFNGMVHPHIPFAIKGVIWYQGEANAQNEQRAKEYEELLRLLITGWRARWGQGDFPFLLVQLPAWTVERPWQTLRNSQFKATTLPNTAMAVALDLNPTDNLHPPRKQEVGRRLSLLAREMAYGEAIVASGPLYRSMSVEGSKVRIALTQTGSGLALGGPPPAYRKPNEDPALEKELLGFQIAAADGAWVSAKAKIDGNSVLVWSEGVTAPANVSYAWAANPKANLYNKEGLPASPFRTDDPPDFAAKK